MFAFIYLAVTYAFVTYAFVTYAFVTYVFVTIVSQMVLSPKMSLIGFNADLAKHGARSPYFNTSLVDTVITPFLSLCSLASLVQLLVLLLVPVYALFVVKLVNTMSTRRFALLTLPPVLWLFFVSNCSVTSLNSAGGISSVLAILLPVWQVIWILILFFFYVLSAKTTVESPLSAFASFVILLSPAVLYGAFSCFDFLSLFIILELLNILVLVSVSSSSSCDLLKAIVVFVWVSAIVAFILVISSVFLISSYTTFSLEPVFGSSSIATIGACGNTKISLLCLAYTAAIATKLGALPLGLWVDAFYRGIGVKALLPYLLVFYPCIFWVCIRLLLFIGFFSVAILGLWASLWLSFTLNIILVSSYYLLIRNVDIFFLLCSLTSLSASLILFIGL